MDITHFNMFRVVTKTITSESMLPRPNHHTDPLIIWEKGEVVQLAAMYRGLYFAKPVSWSEWHQASIDDYSAYLLDEYFRELTPSERKACGFPGTPGEPFVRQMRAFGDYSKEQMLLYLEV